MPAFRAPLRVLLALAGLVAFSGASGQPTQAASAAATTPATASACAVDGAAVGSGKRLVIEHVSANIRVSRGKAVEFGSTQIEATNGYVAVPIRLEAGASQEMVLRVIE